jgi:hypothetical protein
VDRAPEPRRFRADLAAEKLAAEHGFSFSSETVRKWMIADWQAVQFDQASIPDHWCLSQKRA